MSDAYDKQFIAALLQHSITMLSLSVDGLRRLHTHLTAKPPRATAPNDPDDTLRHRRLALLERKLERAEAGKAILHRKLNVARNRLTQWADEKQAELDAVRLEAQREIARRLGGPRFLEINSDVSPTDEYLRVEWTAGQLVVSSGHEPDRLLLAAHDSVDALLADLSLLAPWRGALEALTMLAETPIVCGACVWDDGHMVGVSIPLAQVNMRVAPPYPQWARTQARAEADMHALAFERGGTVRYFLLGGEIPATADTPSSTQP